MRTILPRWSRYPVAMAMMMAAVIALVACDPGSPGSGPSVPTPPVASPTKLLTVVVENHSRDEMRTQMPYLYGLAQRYGYASNYAAVAHPSLPNYLAIVGGSTFSVRDDGAPSTHALSGPTVFGSALNAGKTARVYAEGMTSNCLSHSVGRYAVKHNPWPYFSQERAACLANDVAAGTPATGALHDDVANGTLPNAGLLIPDLCNDAHDCALSSADRYLAEWLSPILAGPDFTSGRLVVVITADEDDYTQTNHVLTVVMHRSLDGAHLVVTTPLTHFSLTRFYATVLGTPPLESAATAPDMARPFAL
jgi:hypothetical protein